MIPLFKPYMSERLPITLFNTLYSGQITCGPRVLEFERALSKFIGNDLCTALSAGTHALHLALRLAGIDHGDEVITTPLTSPATNWAILMQGATPVWADVQKGTCNISVASIQGKMTRKTKAVMMVHWGGYPCEIDEINEFAVDNKLTVIEDAAHAFGAVYKNKMIGNHSEYVCFSFQAIKHLTCVDGGALMIKIGEDHDYKGGTPHHRAGLLKFFGVDRNRPKSEKDFRCDGNILEWGYKYQMNDVSATIGLANIKDMPRIIAHHRENAEYYKGALQDVGNLKLMDEVSDRLSSYWLFTIKVDRQDDFIAAMLEHGIQVSRVHNRNDAHKCVRHLRAKLPNLDLLEAYMICIPVGWWISRDDREYIVEKIKEGW